MADRHKHRPITFRPSKSEWPRLDAYTERTGLPVRQVLGQALAQFLDRESGVTTKPAETPQQAPVETPRKRQPRPKERTEEKPPACTHPKGRRSKGLCMACGNYVGAP